MLIESCEVARVYVNGEGCDQNELFDALFSEKITPKTLRTKDNKI